jgi:hypothetical protein
MSHFFFNNGCSHDFLNFNVDVHSLEDGFWSLCLILQWEDGRCVGAAMKVVNVSDEVVLAEALVRTRQQNG